MPGLRTALVALSLVAACRGGVTDPGGPPALLTELPRPLSTSESKVRDAANAFSFKLWQQINTAQPNENVFVSPLSASFALGMTMNGTAGQTYTEMNSALQYAGAPLADVNAGYRALIDLLVSLDPGVQMKIANSVWTRADFPFNKSFSDTVSRYFSATTRALDFDNQTSALGTINGWVSDATNSRIPKVLDEIRREQVMFLINAIYFKGRWRLQFDPARTSTATFNAAGGTSQSTPLMNRLDTMSYVETAAYQAVDLPYGNGAFSMTVLLPKQGTSVETLASSLDAASLQSLQAGLHTRKVDLYLPRLKMTWNRKLNDDLQALGMRNAFTGPADFTPMSPQGHNLVIDFVKQNTFVEINEEGTEAAAVTTTGIQLTSAPVVTTMRVDRPYLFLIREHLTGTVLFMGKIVKMPG